MYTTNQMVEMSSTPSVMISKELLSQLKFLNASVKTKEWSGELITEEIGSIEDLNTFTIKAKGIYLADIGSAAYTSYTVGEDAWAPTDIVEMYQQFPELLEGKYKLHHIHSHVDMGVFFSGEDLLNLSRRADCYNYTMMLIVNRTLSACAKLALKGSVSQKTMSIKLNNDKDNRIIKLNNKIEPTTFYADCDVIFEEIPTVEPWFVDRCIKINEISEAKIKAQKAANINKFDFKDKTIKNSEFITKGKVKTLPKGRDYDRGELERVHRLEYLEAMPAISMTEKEWEEYNFLSELEYGNY